jgi:hypothetical protein
LSFESFSVLFKFNKTSFHAFPSTQTSTFSSLIVTILPRQPLKPSTKFDAVDSRSTNQFSFVNNSKVSLALIRFFFASPIVLLDSDCTTTIHINCWLIVFNERKIHMFSHISQCSLMRARLIIFFVFSFANATPVSKCIATRQV